MVEKIKKDEDDHINFRFRPKSVPAHVRVHMMDAILKGKEDERKQRKEDFL